ncbi:MAG: hypothetical protein F4164_04350 [Gemmatimonadales bacterium]|nr:hypothetical protein [Gemmatimonadota bacterium]MYG48604.1 hypothetical protein [Gemmatimonadales bacterium]MYK00341.1 hypothetical protein [Candidatus Palauibacter ramosifaciens]
MLRSASIALLAVVLTACMESVPTEPVSFAESPRVGDSSIALQTTWTFNPQDNTSEKERRRRNVHIAAPGTKKYRIRIRGQLRNGTTHTKAKSLPKDPSHQAITIHGLGPSVTYQVDVKEIQYSYHFGSGNSYSVLTDWMNVGSFRSNGCPGNWVPRSSDPRLCEAPTPPALPTTPGGGGGGTTGPVCSDARYREDDIVSHHGTVTAAGETRNATFSVMSFREGSQAGCVHVYNVAVAPGTSFGNSDCYSTGFYVRGEWPQNASSDFWYLKHFDVKTCRMNGMK